MFTSNATNLVPDDTNVCQSQWANTLSGRPGSCADVFLRDIEAETTRRISVGPSGEQANGESWGGVKTPDGLYVAFRSRADNLAPGFAEACSKREFPDWCHGIFLFNAQTAKLESVMAGRIMLESAIPGGR